MEKVTGGQAFPRPAGDYNGSRHGNGSQDGMTLRDYFAAHAPEPPDDFGWNEDERDSWQRLTRWRYYYADAMLKARAE